MLGAFTGGIASILLELGGRSISTRFASLRMPAPAFPHGPAMFRAACGMGSTVCLLTSSYRADQGFAGAIVPDFPLSVSGSLVSAMLVFEEFAIHPHRLKDTFLDSVCVGSHSQCISKVEVPKSPRSGLYDALFSQLGIMIAAPLQPCPIRRARYEVKQAIAHDHHLLPAARSRYHGNRHHGGVTPNLCPRPGLFSGGPGSLSCRACPRRQPRTENAAYGLAKRAA